MNRRGLEQKYVGIRDFIATDCEDGTGILDLRRAIARETDRLPDLRVKFPASWLSIKDRLTYENANFLDFKTFRNICVEFGETDPQAQEEVS